MDDYETKRQDILRQMSNIEKMQLGRLTEEFRKREVEGRIQVTGPYYKHQQWRDGKNVTTRVKPDKAEALRKGVEGLDHFKRLSAEFVEATVAMTDLNSQEDASSKKNSK
jgi:hypothetical protein